MLTPTAFTPFQKQVGKFFRKTLARTPDGLSARRAREKARRIQHQILRCSTTSPETVCGAGRIYIMAAPPMLARAQSTTDQLEGGLMGDEVSPRIYIDIDIKLQILAAPSRVHPRRSLARAQRALPPTATTTTTNHHRALAIPMRSLFPWRAARSTACARLRYVIASSTSRAGSVYCSRTYYGLGVYGFTAYDLQCMAPSTVLVLKLYGTALSYYIINTIHRTFSILQRKAVQTGHCRLLPILGLSVLATRVIR